MFNPKEISKLFGRIALVFALTTLVSTLYAQTYYTSTQSSSWSTAFSSSGSGAPHIYTINSGHTVQIDTNITDVERVDVYGTIQMTNGVKLNLTETGVVVIHPGGLITGGNGGSHITFVNGPSIIPTGGFNEPGGTSGQYGNGGTNGAFVSGLPVSWLNVNASTQADVTTVSWQTASESNNSHFEIETYNAGVWTSAGMVPSHAVGGNSAVTLSYEHKLLNANATIVRIKQVDFDGQYSYSKSVAINASPLKNTVRTIAKGDNNVFLSYGSDVDVETLATVEVYDLKGTLIHSIEKLNANGENVNLPQTGIYVIVYKNETTAPVVSKIWVD